VGLHWPLVLVKVKVMVYGVQRVERSSAFNAEGRTGAWMRGRRATCVVRCEVLMSASARRGIGKGVRCSGVYTVASGFESMFGDAVMLPLAGRKLLRSGVGYLVVLILSHSGRDGRCPLRRVGLRRNLQPPSIFSTARRIVLPVFWAK